jgi:hypothetical protein
MIEKVTCAESSRIPRAGMLKTKRFFRPENLAELKAGAAGNHAKGSMQASLVIS